MDYILVEDYEENSVRSKESYLFRRKLLYDHSEGVLHIEAVIGFVSIILTIAAIACCTIYYCDPVFFLIFGALTGLAGLVLSWAVIIEAASYRNVKRILTALLGNLLSLASLIMDVLMFMVFVLHIVPDFLMGLVG